MMAPKDVRPLLTALSAESLVSVTEIAKSADRNPARMFFLWYVDSLLHVCVKPNFIVPCRVQVC